MSEPTDTERVDFLLRGEWDSWNDRMLPQGSCNYRICRFPGDFTVGYVGTRAAIDAAMLAEREKKA